MTEDLSIRPQRKNDKCITDIIFSHFNPSELQKINKVRIALQLITIADITDSSGRMILPDILRGISHRQSSLQWPRQPLIQIVLPLWQRACKIIQSHIKIHSLGQWYKTHQKWKWMVSSDHSHLSIEDEIYAKSTNRWKSQYLPTTQHSS